MLMNWEMFHKDDLFIEGLYYSIAQSTAQGHPRASHTHNDEPSVKERLCKQKHGHTQKRRFTAKKPREVLKASDDCARAWVCVRCVRASVCVCVCAVRDWLTACAARTQCDVNVCALRKTQRERERERERERDSERAHTFLPVPNVVVVLPWSLPCVNFKHTFNGTMNTKGFGKIDNDRERPPQKN